MSRLDRAIVRNVLEGKAVFTDKTAHRFATVGQLELVRNIPTEKWHLIIKRGDQIKLNWIAQFALNIAARYAQHGAALEHKS
ncbi:hypothetical protein ABE527_02660 [Brucella sp. TWI432]